MFSNKAADRVLAKASEVYDEEDVHKRRVFVPLKSLDGVGHLSIEEIILVQ